MRSLTERQWSRYFELCERLRKCSPEELRAVLQRERTTTEGEQVAALVDLYLALPPEPDRCRTGERIRNLALVEPIGYGGMGVVYRALQQFADGIEREVAVKLIHPELLMDAPGQALARFQAEIASLVKLEHRGIARIYDGGLHRDPASGEETLFLAMELIRGESLTQYVAARRQRLGVVGTLQLFCRVCESVAHAHNQGVVHRDLKPDNILVDVHGDPHIIDFGLAQTRIERPASRRPGHLSGTPAYMSPERLSGTNQPYAPASDVFALGVILRELLSAHSLTAAPEDAAPSMPARHSVSICAEVLQIIAKATATRPQHRYACAGALCKAVAAGIEAQAKRDQRDQQYLEVLLKKVQDFWIDGVLAHSLHATAAVQLNLSADPNAIEQPWNLLLQTEDQAVRALPAGTPVSEVFRDQGEAMLILGEPGSGKTTLLLELARQRLEQAMHEPAQAIPVVFHLSSWASQRLPLEDWLIDELDKRYGVPDKIARRYIDGDRLVCLLDGLDEMAPRHRARCVEAINTFRLNHAATALAVCSRTHDYRVLSVKLRLAGAVLIQPLNRDQVHDYLLCCGEPLQGLRALVKQDEQLAALMRVPLWLSIATLAYGQARHESPALPSLNSDRPAQLFAVYVEAMFRRRTSLAPCTRDQTWRWLRWLARAMLRHHQSVFYPEWMQPDWLPRRWQRWLVGPGSVVLCGLSVGIVLGLYGSMSGGPDYALPVALGFGLVGGLIFGWLGYGDEVRPITRLRWSWTALRERIARKLAVALGVGVFLGTGVALVLEPRAAIVSGVGASLLFCYFGGLDFELIRRDASRRTLPNEGIRRSLRNAALGALIGASGGGIAGTLAGGVFTGVLGAALLGLIVGYALGGFTCLQHALLRLLLWRDDAAPLRYVRFLEYAVERVFLHRVGGGYAFVHRALLEYFAQAHSAENASTEPATAR